MARFNEKNKLFVDNNMKSAHVAVGLHDENNINNSFYRLMRDTIILLFTSLPISAKKLGNYIVVFYEYMDDSF